MDMKIKLIKDTRVILPAGVVLDVDAEQARRLLNLGRCEIAADQEEAPKKRKAKTEQK